MCWVPFLWRRKGVRSDGMMERWRGDKAGNSQQDFLITIFVLSLVRRTDGWKMDMKSSKTLLIFLFYLPLFPIYLFIFFTTRILLYMNSLFTQTIFKIWVIESNKIKRQLILVIFLRICCYSYLRFPSLPIFFLFFVEEVIEPVPTWRSQFVSLLMWWLPVQYSLIFFS